MQKLKLLLLVVLVSSLAYAGVNVISAASAAAQVWFINAYGSGSVTQGRSSRATYIATASGATTTAAYNVEVESSASIGFQVTKVCVSYALGATAAGTIITTTLRRTTTAGSAGTALTANGTGTTAISILDGTATTFPGTARGLASTPGTSGATIDQWSFPQTVIAGTTGITPATVICKDYGQAGDQTIIVPAGTANGFLVQVSAGGAGSLAVGAISVTLIAE